ncbi:ABC transporter ATP-binding protein [Mesorhizobium mediterraneum]|uniref:ABC transporter ATP-binding protein n=1 Tax=Mesorhizobium mediterraneum TaxID=43617 RepID=UPI001782A62C|nr:polysaccharide ABC transporter ATP-binding protein [Mesorhizobium mediterraneum]
MTELPAVEVRGLSKRYRRGAIGVRSLREEVEQLVARLRSREAKASLNEFFAIKNITFSVPTGTVCGIIGRNGSGKTTLLKVLTSITAPDEGEAVMRGRIGSLLEVGAGFHPDLDGIENIYLNGAILGMSKAEITRKLDRIIKFADIGSFLETPVKRYSSGMYVRLAFAIAAHLEPEILVVDEVLAVGDAEFQRKCLGTMKNVAGEGRTVLFVSHNMAMVRQHCTKAIYLDRGLLKDFGEASSIIDAYLSNTAPSSNGSERVGDDDLWMQVAIVYPGTRERCSQLKFGGDYDFVLKLGARNSFHRSVVCIKIFDQEGNLISVLESLAEGVGQFDIVGQAKVVFSVRSLGLLPGTYSAGAALFSWGEDDPGLASENLLTFDVVAATVNDSYWPYQKEHGIVRLSHSAQLLKVD